MAQWHNGSNSAGDSPLFGPSYVNLTTNTTNQANLYQNSTPGAFASANVNWAKVIGVWGVTTTAKNQTSNVTSTENKHIAHTGWVMRKAGTGPVVNVAISNVGGNFANGEIAVITGGITNATATITLFTNTSGNLTSTVITKPGKGFPNNSATNVVFIRNMHVSNVTVTGVTSGYNNTDVVTCSNGIVNATASVSTNTTGGITNTSFTITNVGLFDSGVSNNMAVVHIANSTGGVSSGTGATFNVNLTTSTNGGLTITVGGRANRVEYETLVASSSLIGAGSARFPNT